MTRDDGRQTEQHTGGQLGDARLERMLRAASPGAWPGPDTNPRVEHFLKEQSMSNGTRSGLSRGAVALIAAGVLGAGGLAAAVTHQVMSRRATIITDDGSEYQVELLDTPEGAAGSWQMEDGTVYGINMIENGENKEVTVDVESPTGGTSTVILDNGIAPTVKTNPGQKAVVRVREGAGEGKGGAFIDEDGNVFEVDQDAVDSWVQDEDASDD